MIQKLLSNTFYNAYIPGLLAKQKNVFVLFVARQFNTFDF